MAVCALDHNVVSTPMTRFLPGLLFAAQLFMGPAWGQQGIQPPATQASVALTMNTATTTQIVAAVAGQRIYVVQWNIVAAGTTTVTWVTGTGANCATNQTSLTGGYQLTAQTGAVVGTGNGAVLVVPLGQALCLTNSAGVAIPGSLAYAIF